MKYLALWSYGLWNFFWKISKTLLPSFYILNVRSLKHCSKGNSWICSIYACIFFKISYLHYLDLVLCLYLSARTCSSIICIAIASFKSMWRDCIFFMYSNFSKWSSKKVKWCFDKKKLNALTQKILYQARS